MNPLGWKREHLAAWVAACLLGVVIGLAFGFLHFQYMAGFQYSDGDYLGIWFLVWLGTPQLYWPWPTLGGIIAGLGFYAAKLARV